MVAKEASKFKPEIIHPESREYQTLVADLKKRDQYLDPGEQVARHYKYPHLFATDQGRVINAWRRSETRPARIAALNQNKDGYLQFRVTIAKDKCRTFLVHRIILECFKGPAPEGHETCHRNSVRDDNRPSNLYWGTREVDQVNDKIIAGSIPVGEKHASAVLTRVLVIEARQRVKAGASVRALASEFNVEEKTLDPAVYGVTWSHLNEVEPPAVRKVQSSQLKGICWDKKTGKWRAFATVDGKQSRLGYFTNESDAAFFFDRQCRLDPSCTSRPNKIPLLDCTHRPAANSDDIQNAKPIGPARPAGFQVFAKKESKQDSKRDGGAG